MLFSYKQNVRTKKHALACLCFLVITYAINAKLLVVVLFAVMLSTLCMFTLRVCTLCVTLLVTLCTVLLTFKSALLALAVKYCATVFLHSTCKVCAHT